MRNQAADFLITVRRLPSKNFKCDQENKKTPTSDIKCPRISG